MSPARLAGPTQCSANRGLTPPARQESRTASHHTRITPMIRTFPLSVALLLSFITTGTALAAPAVAFTGNAPATWSLDVARVDTKPFSDRDHKITVVPRDVNGAALLV